jgi:TRAP-type C4-dicarboxylate transport system substrate-binding protein
MGKSKWLVLSFVLLFAFPLWGQQISLKFASYFPTAAKQSKLLEEFCKDVEKRTNGKVKIDFFGGGSLLEATKVYDGVVQGIADIGFSHVEYTVGRFPVTEILDLPHGWPSAYVGTHVANDFYRKFAPAEWKDVKVLWFNTSPVNVLILSKKPVYKLEEMKGLIVRGPGRIAEVLKALGATPKPVPMPEVYEAMARGVVDGTMTPVETLYSFRLADVAKYVTMCWEVGNVYTFYVVVNKKVWDGLPAEVKKVFEQLSTEYEEKAARIWNEVDFDGEKVAKEKGVKFIYLSPDEAKRWQAAVLPVKDAYYADLEKKAGLSRSQINAMDSFIKERIAYWIKKQKEAGIKSITGPEEIRVK